MGGGGIEVGCCGEIEVCSLYTLFFENFKRAFEKIYQNQIAIILLVKYNHPKGDRGTSKIDTYLRNESDEVLVKLAHI